MGHVELLVLQLGGSAWGHHYIDTVYTNVSCTGNESSLADCTKQNIGARMSCPFRNNSMGVASVICYNTSRDLVDTGKETKDGLLCPPPLSPPNSLFFLFLSF